MLTPVQSQRYAQLVNNFSESEFYAYYKHLSNGGTVEDFFENVEKHGDHDQKTHGNWASGNYENLSDWYKDEVKVFGSETEREVYFMEKLFSQRLKGFTELAHPEFTQAISFYQSAGGYHMNEALRDPQISDDGYKGTIDSLDKAIETAPALSEELVAYRGVKGNGLDFFTIVVNLFVETSLEFSCEVTV